MRYTASLLDKLCPSQPDAAAGANARGLTLDEVKDSVATDLEALLNTRRPIWADTAQLGRWVPRSIAAYGIEDFSSRSLASGLDRDHICESIRLAVECHETRLRSVKVALDPRDDGLRQRLKFVIRAMLVLSEAHEPVSFDACYEPAVQRYAVGRGRGG